jgi:hypothetical protein
MGYVFYFGFGILTHLIAWGSGWFGLASLALVIFWPFFVVFWVGVWALIIGTVIFVLAFLADYFGVARIF